MEASILVIDDDPWMAEAVQPVLLQAGCHLDYAHPGELDLGQLTDERPDMVVLSINRQHDDWFYYLQLAILLKTPLFLFLDPEREFPRVPGLDASHFLARALYLIEHGTRIGALLQANPDLTRQPAPFLFVDAELTVDLSRGKVWRSGQLIRLTPTELRLLTPFVRHPGVLLDHFTLLKEVWGPNHRRGPRALRPHIHSLRRKLEPDPSRPLRIVTYRGRGYVFRLLHER
jgi:two-component system, OmpR family, KDP operon response regulator KdpE